MKCGKKSIFRGMLGFLGGLAVLLASNVVPTYALDDEVSELAVYLNEQALGQGVLKGVTPGTEYRLKVCSKVDTSNPLAVDLSVEEDETGAVVESKARSNDVRTEYTLTPVVEDAGKTILLTFKTKETTPRSVTIKLVVRKPTLNVTSKVITKGKKFTLKVLYLKNPVRWTTSNSKIATVKNGVVTAKSTGTVTIKAKSGNYKMSCKVRISNPEIVNSSGDGVEGISVTTGFSRKLKVKSGIGSVTWKSSNTKIATVKNGTVKGLKTGSCYIYATVDGKTLKCKVTSKDNVFKTTPTRNGRYMQKGRVSLSNASMKYSKGALIYKCYAVNSTSYKKVERYNNITISIYEDNKLVAKQTFKNIKLNLTKYKSKALTFTFSKANVKRIANLRTAKITVRYSYDYQYLN